MIAPTRRHERVYRSLLRLYPADYRHAYGDQMVQLFGDQLREAGGTQTWLRTSGDLVTSAASEHLRRNRTVAHSMSLAPTPASRLLGLLGVLGGVVLLAAFVVEISSDLNMGRIFLFLVGGMAVVVAVHRRQSAISPALALAGAVPALLAGSWLLIMELLLLGRSAPLFGGTFGWVHFWASIATWLSYAWFGLVTYRLGAVSRLGALALIVGSSLAILGIDRLGLVSADNPTIFNILSQVGIAIHGLAWILLGLDVALRSRPAQMSGS